MLLWRKHTFTFTLISEIGAKTRFVMASPTVILAPAAGSSKPLIGCSPIEVADPVYKLEKAV